MPSTEMATRLCVGRAPSWSLPPKEAPWIVMCQSRGKTLMKSPQVTGPPNSTAAVKAHCPSCGLAHVSCFSP